MNQITLLAARACTGSCRLLVFLVAAVLLLGLTHTVTAHGGGTPRLSNEPVGSYLVSAWTNPDPLRAGIVHVTVSIAEIGSDGAAGEAVLNADVLVRAELSGETGLAPVEDVATHEKATNQLFYETDLTLPEPGNWRMTVDVSGAGTADFSVEVLPAPSATNSNLLLWAAAILAVIAAGSAVAFSQRRRTVRVPGESRR